MVKGTRERESARRALLSAAGILLLLALAVVGSYNYRQVSDPFVDGRHLSAWLDEFLLDRPVDRQQQATTAIEHAGTNAIPLLLARLAYRESFWKHAFYMRFGRRDVPHEAQVRSAAVNGFS